MAFEKTIKYRAPDGTEHDTAEAAKAHMKAAAFGILGAATSSEFEACVTNPSEMIELRTALRDVFLAAWPRASKGKPRGPRKVKETPSPATKMATE